MNINFKIDKNNPLPIGLQLGEQIKMLVNSGDLKPGDRLPAINQLASFSM